MEEKDFIRLLKPGDKVRIKDGYLAGFVPDLDVFKNTVLTIRGYKGQFIEIEGAQLYGHGAYWEFKEGWLEKVNAEVTLAPLNPGVLAVVVEEDDDEAYLYYDEDEDEEEDAGF